MCGPTTVSHMQMLFLEFVSNFPLWYFLFLLPVSTMISDQGCLGRPKGWSWCRLNVAVDSWVVETQTKTHQGDTVIEKKKKKKISLREDGLEDLILHLSCFKEKEGNRATALDTSRLPRRMDWRFFSLLRQESVLHLGVMGRPSKCIES